MAAAGEQRSTPVATGEIETIHECDSSVMQFRAPRPRACNKTISFHQPSHQLLIQLLRLNIVPPSLTLVNWTFILDLPAMFFLDSKSPRIISSLSSFPVLVMYSVKYERR
jgi:hypothetical protein